MPIDDQDCPELVCCNENPFVGECCQPTPFDYSSQQFSNTEQNYTATCPEGLCGEPVSVTVPSGAYTSTVSQADADAQALAAAQAAAEDALSCVECGPPPPPPECTPETFDAITPTIEDDTPSYFGSSFNYPAGFYRVTYTGGALQYNPAFDFGLNDSAIHRFTILYNDGAVEVVAPALDYQKFATQAALESHNAGQFVEFTHAGGKIGVYLEDFPYSDNVPGSPNPTYQLSRICTAPPPAPGCGIDAPTVENIMRVIQERQFVISGIETNWLDRTNPGTEVPPLPLTPTPAYPPDGFFSGDSSDAERAIQVQVISNVLSDSWIPFYATTGEWESLALIPVFYVTSASPFGTDRSGVTQLPQLVVTDENWEESLTTLQDYCCQLQWIVVSKTGDASTSERRQTPAFTGSDCGDVRAAVIAYWTASTSWGDAGGFCLQVVEESMSTPSTLSIYFDACRSRVQFSTNLMVNGVATSFWKLGPLLDVAIAGHLDVAPVPVVDNLFHQGSDAPPLDGTDFFSALYGDVGDTITFEADCPPFPSDPEVTAAAGWVFQDAVIQVFKSPDPALNHWNYYV